MKLTRGDKLLLVGSSVTDAGRNYPDGEGLGDALGFGYVALVDALLGANYPDLGIRIVNRGISGNTVRDLKARWLDDVIAVKPDWLSILIGNNDVWRQYDSPTRPERQVCIAEYEQTLDDLVLQTLPSLKGLVLMTPYYMEPNPVDAMRATMDEYGKVVAAIAKKHGTLYVDTQAALNKSMKHYYPATLGWDRIHLNQTGNMVIAKALLKVLDFEWR